MDTLEYIKKSLNHYYEICSIDYAKRRKTNGALFGKFYYRGSFNARAPRYFVIVNGYVRTFPTEKIMLCELNKI